MNDSLALLVQDLYEDVEDALRTRHTMSNSTLFATLEKFGIQASTVNEAKERWLDLYNDLRLALNPFHYMITRNGSRFPFLNSGRSARFRQNVNVRPVIPRSPIPGPTLEPLPPMNRGESNESVTSEVMQRRQRAQRTTQQVQEMLPHIMSAFSTPQFAQMFTNVFDQVDEQRRSGNRDNEENQREESNENQESEQPEDQIPENPNQVIVPDNDDDGEVLIPPDPGNINGSINQMMQAAMPMVGNLLQNPQFSQLLQPSPEMEQRLQQFMNRSQGDQEQVPDPEID